MSIYLLFVTANRIAFERGLLSLFFKNKPLLSKCLSTVFIIIGCGFLYLKIGVTNTLLVSLVVWPTLASLVVVFAPLYKPNKYCILLFFCITIFLEFTIL